MHWDAQGSGTTTPPDVAVELERAWKQFVGCGPKPVPVVEVTAIEGMGTETSAYVRGRSRQPRDAALGGADGICCVCDQDYSQILDGKGIRVLQVHQTKQLAVSDRPRLTKVSDLAVVCANCHALIHMNPKKALTIATLRRMLRDESATT